VDIVKRDGVAYLGFKEQLPKLAADWSQAYKNDLKIEPQPTSQCAKCEFRATPGDGLKSGFEECWSEKFGFTHDDLARGTILDIWDFRDKSKLIAALSSSGSRICGLLFSNGSVGRGSCLPN
jgi:hypothetical protein